MFFVFCNKITSALSTQVETRFGKTQVASGGSGGERRVPIREGSGSSLLSGLRQKSTCSRIVYFALAAILSVVVKYPSFIVKFVICYRFFFRYCFLLICYHRRRLQVCPVWNNFHLFKLATCIITTGSIVALPEELAPHIWRSIQKATQDLPRATSRSCIAACVQLA